MKTNIKLTLNGKSFKSPTQSLVELLEFLKLNPKYIAIEHNEQALLKESYPSVKLKEGDRLEFIQIVAGG